MLVVRRSKAVRVLAGLLSGSLLLLACRAPRKAGPSPDPNPSAALVEEAKAAARIFLDRRAADAGSGESFEFESCVDEGSELVLKYRAHHPDWFSRTHSLVTVAYDPAEKTTRFVGR